MPLPSDDGTASLQEMVGATDRLHSERLDDRKAALEREVTQIRSAAEVVENTVAEARAVLSRLSPGSL